MTKQVQDLGLSDEISQDIAMLESKIAVETNTHLEKYRQEMVAQIEMDIAARYYYEEGKTRQRLKNDPELQEAIALLNDQGRYNALLR